jgi:hypothetical protein
MFRGFGILCLYLWLLGLNVYMWNINNINYKICFGFKNHYSNLITIFQRAAGFTSIFVLIFLIYMIIRTEIPFFLNLFNNIPVNILPLICYSVCIIYLFCPLKNTFNYEGRIYFYTVLLEGFLSIFNKIEFKHVWLYDQLTSFIGPIRDYEYTMCYYVFFQKTDIEKKLLCSGTRNVVLFLGILPHLIRTLHCIRVILDTGKFYPQIWNAGKYFCAILTAILSFFVNFYPQIYPIWCIVAIISTFYSFFWDIKFDFGFLENGKNYPLRDKLSYKNKFFYYFISVLNLFLRFMWVLSTSPEIVFQWFRPEFVSLIIYSMEVIRRGFWNFIRVELAHIQICKEFKVTNYVELPFKKNERGEFTLREKNIADIMKINKRLDKIKAQTMFNDFIKVDKEEKNSLLNNDKENKKSKNYHINLKVYSLYTNYF